MHRYIVIVLLATAAAISAVPASEEILSESLTAALAKTVVGFEGVTPLRSIFLPYITDLPCWICRPPCGGFVCCDNGYPQCCMFGPRCSCCRV